MRSLWGKKLAQLKQRGTRRRSHAHQTRLLSPEPVLIGPPDGFLISNWPTSTAKLAARSVGGGRRSFAFWGVKSRRETPSLSAPTSIVKCQDQNLPRLNEPVWEGQAKKEVAVYFEKKTPTKRKKEKKVAFSLSLSLSLSCRRLFMKQPPLQRQTLSVVTCTGCAWAWKEEEEKPDFSPVQNKN
jgi:hypothetical protein